MHENQPVQQITVPQRDHEAPTLKIAGASYTLGDVMMMLAGIARHGAEHARGTIQGGAIWLAGGLAAARYGNPSAEKQLQIHATKLQHHLQQNGIVIPESVRERSDLLAQRGVWQRIEEFCYQHPSELLNGAYSIGASMVLADGIKELQRGRTLLPKTLNLKGLEGMSSSFWIGLIVLVGGLTGLLIKEDLTAKPHAEHDGPIRKIWAHAKEKPLRISGALYTANNGFLALRAWQDYTERTTTFAGKKFQPYYASTIQLASYLFANGMLMLSHRDQMAGHMLSTESLDRLEQAAAQIIAAQPAKVQQALLHDISGYLAAQKGMALDAATLHAQLQQKLARLTHDDAHSPAPNTHHADAVVASRQNATAQALTAQ